jgi:hypothetical protein
LLLSSTKWFNDPFHQYIQSELSKAYENQSTFLETKLQDLKNEFVHKQAEHLNFDQIKVFYEQAVKDNRRRHNDNRLV